MQRDGEVRGPRRYEVPAENGKIFRMRNRQSLPKTTLGLPHKRQKKVSEKINRITTDPSGPFPDFCPDPTDIRGIVMGMCSDSQRPPYNGRLSWPPHHLPQPTGLAKNN